MGCNSLGVTNCVRIFWPGIVRNIFGRCDSHQFSFYEAIPSFNLTVSLGTVWCNLNSMTFPTVFFESESVVRGCVGSVIFLMCARNTQDIDVSNVALSNLNTLLPSAFSESLI